MKKYRVNESEIFNLRSMYEHLKYIEEQVKESNDWSDLEDIESRIQEVENLMDHARHIGAMVTWPELKRIREIRDERNAIRYGIAVSNGASDKEAGYAIM